MYVPAVVPDVTTLGPSGLRPVPATPTTPPNLLDSGPRAGHLTAPGTVELPRNDEEEYKLARAAPLPAYHGIPLRIWLDEGARLLKVCD